MDEKTLEDYLKLRDYKQLFTQLAHEGLSVPAGKITLQKCPIQNEMQAITTAASDILFKGRLAPEFLHRFFDTSGELFVLSKEGNVEGMSQIISLHEDLSYMSFTGFKEEYRDQGLGYLAIGLRLARGYALGRKYAIVRSSNPAGIKSFLNAGFYPSYDRRNNHDALLQIAREGIQLYEERFDIATGSTVNEDFVMKGVYLNMFGRPLAAPRPSGTMVDYLRKMNVEKGEDPIVFVYEFSAQTPRDVIQLYHRYQQKQQQLFLLSSDQQSKDS